MLRRRSGDQGDLWGYDGSNYSLWCTAAASEGKFACNALPSVLHAASSECRHQKSAVPLHISRKIGALWLVLVTGASALSLDRRVALRAAAVAVVCPEPAKAVLACVDGQGPWCGGLEPATNDRAQSAASVKAAYEAELRQLVAPRNRPSPPEPSDSQEGGEDNRAATAKP